MGVPCDWLWVAAAPEKSSGLRPHRGFSVTDQVINVTFCDARHTWLVCGVVIDSNRYDPLVPWTAANQLGRDWCTQGADVEMRTNEEPPFLNKLVINHALPMLVDGEPGHAMDRRPLQRRTNDP